MRKVKKAKNVKKVKIKMEIETIILEFLREQYPDAKCELLHSSIWQLLVATILSAQCTDVQVNKITPALFERFPEVDNMAKAELFEIEDLVRATGFFHNKAKNIQASARMIVSVFAGKVPSAMEELLRLPGVGRKTANVVLSNGFGINSGIVVDTHVKRISYRLGLTKHQENVEKIEEDLMEKFPQKVWGELSHLMIFHGRKLCHSRSPKCEECGLKLRCHFYAR
ncbi:MAG: endonuclease III [Oligoflexia bacterium]|nr:endonuclease III [Oligoflexia bacterium]MBF0367799.1 endonuclease III [Oligoflexia bacterium]